MASLRGRGYNKYMGFILEIVRSSLLIDEFNVN